MSGIAGIYNLNGRPVNGDLLKAMTRTVEHRGPNGVGYWAQGPVGFGHLQFHTTPESLGERQPLASANGDYAVTWDGRLDNREELIARLRSVTNIAQDAPDVELVLQAYVKWGPECVKHIVGDFAFALWDGPRQRLFCARDPIGVRVLHYYADSEHFIFGSEIRELLSHPAVQRRPNATKVALYLCRSEGDAEQTFYEGIFRLPGGYALLASKDGVKKWPFWKVDTADEIRFPNHNDYAERFRDLFFEAVRCRLRSTGPTGILLSGGLDSSSIACAAEQIIGAKKESALPLEAFSWVFTDQPEVDESAYVRTIIHQYGTRVTWIRGDSNSTAAIAQDDWMDEPLRRPHETINREMFAVVRNAGIQALLTGEGGDETLTVARLEHLCDWLRGFRLMPLWKELQSLDPEYRQRIVRYLMKSLVPPFREKLTTPAWAGNCPTWMDQGFRRREQLESLLKHVWPGQHGPLYRRDQTNTVEARGREGVFLWADVVCAHYNIEWRHPLWDSRLVEFLARIPPELKYQSGQQKVVLRRALKGVLPEKVEWRMGKARFSRPFYDSLGVWLIPRLEGLLGDMETVRMGIVDIARVREALGRYKGGDVSESVPLFVLTSVEEWLRTSLTPAVQIKANPLSTPC